MLLRLLFFFARCLFVSLRFGFSDKDLYFRAFVWYRVKSINGKWNRLSLRTSKEDDRTGRREKKSNKTKIRRLDKHTLSNKKATQENKPFKTIGNLEMTINSRLEGEDREWKQKNRTLSVGHNTAPKHPTMMCSFAGPWHFHFPYRRTTKDMLRFLFFFDLLLPFNFNVSFFFFFCVCIYFSVYSLWL